MSATATPPPLNVIRCSTCNEWLPTTAFTMDRRKPRGFRYQCKSCFQVYHNEYRLKVRQGQRPVRCSSKGSAELWYVAIQRAAQSSKRRGLAFDLNLHLQEMKSRINAMRCEMTGLELRYTTPVGPMTPSIDRIDPKKGYTYDNIRIVCLAMNVAMNNWGEGPLREVVTAWLARRPS